MRHVYSVIALAGLIVCTDAGDANAQRNGYGRGGRGGVGVTISGAGITIGQPGNGYYGNQGYRPYSQNYGNSFGYGGFGNGYNQGFGFNQGFGLNQGYGYNQGFGYNNNRGYYSPAPVYNTTPYYTTPYYTTPNVTQYYTTPNPTTTYTTPNYVVPATYSTPLVQNAIPQQTAPMVTLAQNRAYITVKVPTTDAQVWFAGTTTEATGTERLFNSPVLEVGQTFKYAIKASWTIDGKTKEQTRDVEFRAGQSTTVDFRVDQNENAPQSESDLNK